MARTRTLLAALALWQLAGCAGRPYAYESVEAVGFTARAQTQHAGGLSVSAAVPGAEETRALFGLPLYERGVQPVWISVENRTEARHRFAPVGLDRNYFAPLEVPYGFRSGFSGESREQMNRRFHDLAMSRWIPPGRTVSGFVFSNRSPGTKSFNVDLFSDAGEDHSFTFFVDVPGFVPDHADVDFENLYAPEAQRDLDTAGLRRALAELPCCTSDASGEGRGLAWNAVLVAKGSELLQALLRAKWHETARDPDAAPETIHHFFGRPPDATFRRFQDGGADRGELRLWLAPLRHDGSAVWIAQLTRRIGRRTRIEDVLIGSRLDPDLGDGRNFLLQNLWYGQALSALAWLAGEPTGSVEAPATDFNGALYFFDGRRVVIWASGAPISLIESTSIDWDAPPGW